MNPEQLVTQATGASDRSHMSGVTVGDLIECDSCGEQFPHWARWLDHREQARATAALDAVRDALASDDPAVMRAMAERVGLTALAEGGALHCCCAWCCTGTPREQRGQAHAGCPS